MRRAPNTGAVFTRDTSIPSLGEAFRDPSGLIWGSMVLASGKPNYKTRFDAKIYCQAGGARLPTIEEFLQLANYLGRGTSQGYSPFLSDGKTDFLPGLSETWFWTNSPDGDTPGAYAYRSVDSDFDIQNSRYSSLFRCVSP